MFVDEPRHRPKLGPPIGKREPAHPGKVIADGRKRGMLLVAGSQHATI